MKYNVYGWLNWNILLLDLVSFILNFLNEIGHYGMNNARLISQVLKHFALQG